MSAELINGVIKSETVNGDLYQGTAQQLIEADLVRADQFPLDGRWKVSYYNGERIARNYRKDENFLQVFGRGDDWSVLVGVSITVRRARRVAAKQEFEARRQAEDQKSRDKICADARFNLDHVPKTNLDFVRSVAANVRWSCKRQLEFNWIGHGYSFDPESSEAILIACDAVIEQIMAARVCLDVAKQTALVAGLQSKIVAAQTTRQAHVLAQLTRPNPAILEGRQS